MLGHDVIRLERKLRYIHATSRTCNSMRWEILIIYTFHLIGISSLLYASFNYSLPIRVRCRWLNEMGECVFRDEGKKLKNNIQTSDVRSLLKVPPHDVNKLIHEWNKAQEANAKFFTSCVRGRGNVCVYLRSVYGVRARDSRHRRLWLFLLNWAQLCVLCSKLW